MHDLNEVTAEQWNTLSRRTIYFGHQSVGANIVAGTRELAEQMPHVKLRIVSGEPVAEPGVLNEFPIGTNEDPDSKNAAIEQVTRGAIGPLPVVMFKYCYVDVDDKTDPAKLFERYRSTVATIRRRHPQATVVHVTLPLMTEPSALRVVMNKVRGMSTSREENAVRAQYNRMLRAAYEGREPLFDLAALESTRADGSLEYGIVNGKKIPALAREWSADSGHLNDAGRKRVAAQFLATLARLPATSPASIDPR